MTEKWSQELLIVNLDSEHLSPWSRAQYDIGEHVVMNETDWL